MQSISFYQEISLYFKEEKELSFSNSILKLQITFNIVREEKEE